MKITKIATAAVVPAAIAGAAISYGVASHPAARPAASTTKSDASRKPAATTSASHGAGSSGRAQAVSAKKAPKPVWVTVKRGQTLSSIAAAHHLTWEAIYATPPNMRRLPDPDRLTVGERLRIPSDPKLRERQFKARYAAKLAASPAPQAGTHAASTPAASGSSGSFSAAGMSSFEACVAWRESSDTPTDPDGLFGILPSTWQSLGYSGSAGEYSVAVQEQAFARLYAEDGTAPWAPYDGC